MDRIPEIALEWHRAGKGAALATVIRTWGSAPRRVGSQLVISGDGEIEGSVSGGCVEGAVIVDAIDALEDGQPKILTFGVSDDEAFAVGLACGGEIAILVEPVGKAMPEAMLANLVAARADRRPVAYRVNTVDWVRALSEDTSDPRFRKDQSGFEGDTFIAIHNPPLRMAVIGAVHITQPLVQMARMAGYDPFIIDPREVFGSQARFPDETLSNEWPDEALTDWGIDARTAVITLSHDPKIDDPALHVALKSDAFYIGALGSTRTHAKREARLTAAGFTKDDMARIHSPIGLDIGSANPAEIAIATMAQITGVLRGRP